MLTNQTTQLADSFILHYDAENPPLIKFRGIRNSVLGCCVARGWQGWQVGAVVEIGQELRLFIEKRGRFVLEKLLQVINDTQVDCYAALNDDCKSYLATKIQPSIQAAKGYLEQIRVEANAAIGVTIEASRAFDNLLLGLNAEMDLFCAKYGSKSGLKDQKVKGDNAIFDDQGKDTAGNMIFNINTVQGAVGNISHSPTILNSQNLQNKTSDSPFSENEKQTLEITAKIMSDKSAEPRKSKNPKCVFVVHGRNSALRDSMFAFLRAIGLQPLEWSQAVKATGEASPYIGQVLDTAFSMAQAIVVLMTPDDDARLRKEFHSPQDEDYEKELTPQARPNVLFEAGMAMGRDPKRTILVQIGQLRPFSDVAGRHLLRLKNTSQSRQELANRLGTAGCDVDLNGTDWNSVGSFDYNPQQADNPEESSRQKEDRNAEKPSIAIETLLLPVDVLDGVQTSAFFQKTKKKDMFHVKVRNKSPFPVNIDAIGFTIKERLLRAMFWNPSGSVPYFPKRLESRSSFVMQFVSVETTSPTDIGEIDGVFVETGCGHSFLKADKLFNEWTKTTDMKPIGG